MTCAIDNPFYAMPGRRLTAVWPSVIYIAMAYIGQAIFDRELKKGSAELLILSLVESRARHGYEISKLIEQRSGGALRFHVASLYPLLYRLEKRGWSAFVEAIQRITGAEHA